MDEDQVREHLNKSIPPWTLREVADATKKPLRKPQQLERLPEKWKEDNVTSIFKWSNKEDYGS